MDESQAMAASSLAPDAAGEVSVPQLRKALGRFVTGVTVVTTTDRAGIAAHGMTANAFTSVSLRPPLVLISVARTAKLHPLIDRSGRYGVSILAGDQQALSLHFAGVADLSHQVELVWRDGLPLVQGALAQLTCSVRDTHPAGDHLLYVGEVNGLWHRNGDPLVYYTGAFRALELLLPDNLWGF